MIKTLKTFDYSIEQIQTLLKSKLSAFGGNLLVPSIFFLIFYDVIPTNILTIWLLLQIIVFILRIYFHNKLLKILYNSTKETINKNLKFYLYTIFANSFLWGLIGIFVVIYADELYAYIFFIILIGMGAAAMSSLSSIFHALFVFMSNIMFIPIISFIFIGATKMYYLLALFGAIYLIFILSAGFKSFQYLSDNIKKRKELEEKNNNFKNLLDMTMEAVIILDENHVIEDINQSGLQLLKIMNKSNIIGQNIVKYLPNHALQKLYKCILDKKKAPYELDFTNNDGKDIPVLISSKDFIMNERTVKIITILDISQIKEKDKQLITQSRLAQMGEMISMIAHQWRQPLTAISATSNNLTLKLMMNDVDNKEFEKEIGLISDYAQHLSKTIDDFRGFFKENKEKETTTLDNLVNSTLDIVKISLENKNINIKTDLNSTIELKTYPNEVKQVILNLIKNAQDALLDNKIENPIIIIKTRYKNNNHIITIKDNGGGIPSNIIDKIFEPYFSTKKEKDGTGLGLYMSKTIIEEHCSGDLSVSNDEDGAVFTIKLL
jgi:PAS domain S-box-containing protein